MAEGGALGDRLRKLRRERSMTQEELAQAAGLSQEMIAKTEQGRRHPRLTVLAKVAKALDVSLSELLDDRPRLNGAREGASVLALCDALLSPSLLPGIDAVSEEGDPTPVPQLSAAVAGAGRLYWSGEFARLAATLPALIGEARFSARSGGPGVWGLLGQAYELAAMWPEASTRCRSTARQWPV